MKSKLKSPDVAKAKGMMHVQNCLKKELMQPNLDETGNPVSLKFFYHSNYEYSAETGPILFVGVEIPSIWKKWMKTVKTSKEFAAGNCILGEDMELKLEIKLGKGGKRPVLKEVYKGLLKKTAVKNAIFVDSISSDSKVEASSAEENPTQENANGNEESVEGQSFSFNDVAETIIEKFNTVEKAFDSEATVQVYKNIKDWMQQYKSSEATVKKDAKAKGGELQKIYSKATELIKIDKQIDKTLTEVVKGMDTFHLLNNHTSPEALELIDQLSKSLNQIKGLAEKIKESDLVSVVNSYLSELNN